MEFNARTYFQQGTVVASYRRKMYDLTVVGCMILPL